MKKYNRETRQWEEQTTGQGKFKRRELCKGGKEHDYLLTVPSYISTTLAEELTPELIIEYYAAEERMDQFVEEENKKLQALGLSKHHRRLTGYKYYICSRCGKKTISVGTPTLPPPESQGQTQ